MIALEREGNDPCPASPGNNRGKGHSYTQSRSSVNSMFTVFGTIAVNCTHRDDMPPIQTRSEQMEGSHVVEECLTTCMAYWSTYTHSQLNLTTPTLTLSMRGPEAEDCHGRHRSASHTALMFFRASARLAYSSPNGSQQDTSYRHVLWRDATTRRFLLTHPRLDRWRRHWPRGHSRRTSSSRSSSSLARLEVLLR